MVKRKLKSFVVPMIYICALFVFSGCLYLFQSIFTSQVFQESDIVYVDNEIVTDNVYIPVVNISPTVMKPFLNDGVYISKGFYDKDDTPENQEKAIIFYEGTYMQNSGIDYKYSESFEVISVLDGQVIDISDNDILGKTIKIQHDNNKISIYQSLSSTSINVNDHVLRGQVIGNSGTSKLYPNDFNLHFELINQGVNINPEKYYNKSVDEF